MQKTYSVEQVWQTTGEGSRLVFIEAGNEDLEMDEDDF